MDNRLVRQVISLDFREGEVVHKGLGLVFRVRQVISLDLREEEVVFEG